MNRKHQKSGKKTIICSIFKSLMVVIIGLICADGIIDFTIIL